MNEWMFNDIPAHLRLAARLICSHISQIHSCYSTLFFNFFFKITIAPSLPSCRETLDQVGTWSKLVCGGHAWTFSGYGHANSSTHTHTHTHTHTFNLTQGPNLQDTTTSTNIKYNNILHEIDTYFVVYFLGRQNRRYWWSSLLKIVDNKCFLKS